MVEKRISAGAKIVIEYAEEGSTSFKTLAGLKSKRFHRSRSVSENRPISARHHRELAVWRRSTICTAELSVSGNFAQEDREALESLFDASRPFQMRIRLAVPAGDAGGYWAGNFVMTKFNLDAEDEDEPIKDELEFLSDGAVVWSDEV